MNFDEYQDKAKKYDLFEASAGLNDPGFIAKILGLAEESGEVCGKFKKVIRDDGGVLTDEKKGMIKQELGDVLWYVATIARYMEIDLGSVARDNLDKLEDRMNRNVLKGSGDNR